MSFSSSSLQLFKLRNWNYLIALSAKLMQSYQVFLNVTTFTKTLQINFQHFILYFKCHNILKLQFIGIIGRIKSNWISQYFTNYGNKWVNKNSDWCRGKWKDGWHLYMWGCCKIFILNELYTLKVNNLTAVMNLEYFLSNKNQWLKYLSLILLRVVS